MCSNFVLDDFIIYFSVYTFVSVCVCLISSVCVVVKFNDFCVILFVVNIDRYEVKPTEPTQVTVDC